MNNALIIPIFIPLIFGIMSYFFKKQSYFLVFTGLITVIISIILLMNFTEGMMVLSIGGYEAPFGIQLAGDPLSFTMSLISTGLMLFAFTFKYYRTEERHSNAFLLFLLAGINGSFLTADIFNLFVMFEVVLLASFILVVIDRTTEQFQASIVYVVLNLIGSWIFLIAIGILYRTYGTLNFAHLSERISEHGNASELLFIPILFMVVFALKSALVLFMWLPRTYRVLPIEIAAIFSALLTKVGVYTFIRIYTVVFSAYKVEMGQILLWMSIFTVIIGVIGVLYYKDISMMLMYQIIVSIGITIFGVSTMRETGINGAVFYLWHDMILKFVLVLTVLWIMNDQRIFKKGGMITSHKLLGILFLYIVLAIGGVPPTGGFPGKLMILLAGLKTYHWLFSLIIVIGGFIAMFQLLKVFVQYFFSQTDNTDDDMENVEVAQSKMNLKADSYKNLLMIIMLPVLISFFMSIFSNYIITYIGQMDTEYYIESLMKGD